MKPYRLVNSTELQQISQHCTAVLDEWNKYYSLNPISLSVSLPAKDGLITLSHSECSEGSPSIGAVSYDRRSLTTFGMVGEPLLLMEGCHSTLMNHCLFGEDQPCFNSSSEALLLVLLNQLLSTEHTTLQANIATAQDWIYPGSTCLLLTLTCVSYQINLLLHPDWVYRFLPGIKTTANRLCSLNEVVAAEEVTLELTLIPMNLPLHQLMNMQIGDVLVSDHAIHSPVALAHQKQALAQTELGQFCHYKSIQLKEFL